MKQIIRVFVVLGLISLSVFSVFAIYTAATTDLSPDESDALFGGKLETGYPSAGFMVIYTATGIKTCGYTAVRPNVAITAGHCVDDAERIFLGQGQFNFEHSNHATISRAIPKEGWAVSQRREDDFAVLTFQDANFFREFANISTPIEGCNVRVVAYGRTDNPDAANGEKQRRSGVLCVNQVLDKVIYATGRDAGICFGDSGSPVYFEGTNNLAGVVASIIRTDENANDPCQIGNQAIIVRADRNLNLINDIANEVTPSAEPVQIDESLVIQVASDDDDFGNVLTLSSVENLVQNSERFLPQIVLVGAGFIILVSVLLSLGGGEKRPQPEMRF